MNLSHSIKQRFIKDFGLPIQVVQEPVFTSHLNTLDAHYGTLAKFTMLLEVVEKTGGEEGFFNEAHRVRGKLIEAISNKSAYTELQQDKLDAHNTVNKVTQQKNFYNLENAGKTFMSLDLKHANFNVLRVYDSELVLGFETYEDLVGSVSDFDYFKKSKYLRQVIFGNLLPKKQQRLQKKVMDDVITVLNTSVGIPMEDFVSASADEVVFEVKLEDADSLTQKIKDVLTEDKTNPLFDKLRIESFTMKSIGEKKYFLKEDTTDGSVTFKAVPSLVFMQVFKYHFGLPLDSNDMVFYHEGFLAEFKETVF